MIGKELGLDLGTDAQLAIDALMAAHVLLKEFILQGHAGEVGHQLEMATVHLTPAEATPSAEHIEPAPHAAAGHHRGGDHPGRAEQAMQQGVQQGHHRLITRLGLELAVAENSELADHLGASLPRRPLQLLPPETPIGVEDHQHGPLRLHKP